MNLWIKESTGQRLHMISKAEKNAQTHDKNNFRLTYTTQVHQTEREGTGSI